MYTCTYPWLNKMEKSKDFDKVCWIEFLLYLSFCSPMNVDVVCLVKIWAEENRHGCCVQEFECWFIRLGYALLCFIDTKNSQKNFWLFSKFGLLKASKTFCQSHIKKVYRLCVRACVCIAICLFKYLLLHIRSNQPSNQFRKQQTGRVNLTT